MVFTANATHIPLQDVEGLCSYRDCAGDVVSVSAVSEMLSSSEDPDLEWASCLPGGRGGCFRLQEVSGRVAAENEGAQRLWRRERLPQVEVVFVGLQ